MLRKIIRPLVKLIHLFQAETPRNPHNTHKAQSHKQTGNREGGKHKTGRAKTLEPSAGNHGITLECNALCSMLPREGRHDKLNCDHSVT